MSHIRNWLAASVAVVVLAGPASAQMNSTEDRVRPMDTAELLKRLQNSLDKMTQDQVEQQRQLLDLAEELRKTTERVERLEKNFSTHPTAKPKAGVLVLKNGSSTDAEFLIAGQTYRLAPGTYLELPAHPAGMFNYEIRWPARNYRYVAKTIFDPKETLLITARNV